MIESNRGSQSLDAIGNQIEEEVVILTISIGDPASIMIVRKLLLLKHPFHKALCKYQDANPGRRLGCMCSAGRTGLQDMCDELYYESLQRPSGW